MIRLGVVLGSIRPTRIGADVAQWVVDRANAVEGVGAELVDLAAFDLPVFAEPVPTAMAAPTDPAGAAFNEAVKGFDAIVFVTPEYNHSIPGALKNAIDFLEPSALAHKGVGLVGYSFTGGIRPVEHLRQILSNFEAAVVNAQVSLSLVTDFENMSEFSPAEHHADEVPAMVEAVVARTKALSSLR
ncbi:NAD(P)H-dependent oxidoreductase [Actinomyces sp. B33]|uniref:NADPH-dependent FMN reductase n=1 Tax=Actinomyces sp. B33 TaxID=2942131 RepID=UPI002340D29C|nr:NAD(P)H-dependent oxidoreductase [Actinomyces sp. B33]MDC4233708.1 NAD(P)H-dependent oxidoreductase [Actinomyces sp. B33]